MVTDRDKPLAGRRALVTGANRGIGRAIAKRLAADGATVVLTARDEAALASVLAELDGDGHARLSVDLADGAALEKAIAAIEALGAVDVLVNNAGIAESQPLARTDDDLWARTMAVNATAVFRLTRAFVPKMVEAGWGRAVVVASNAGLTGYAYSSAYCASKHAAVGMVRAIALEIARTPVTINAVCPGWVETAMATRAVERIAGKTGKSVADATKALERMSPQGRMVTPDEVAGMVAYLCREEARSIHGQALALDGGQLLS